ncbi:hypothetical protein RJ640_022402 [Escallonia rubra]|uniref:O-fucosyltransferase family protein n=1 Tax=Escallonia rubra TaxID=112253 RepID=A0AA88R4E2_9ASTE|nr:hypothetical protein RJ640_022402 [Escallonia rubra]
MLMLQREFKKATSKLWEEPYPQASLWRPCADREAPKSAVKVVGAGKLKNSTGFILISANGGLNQQRVALSIQFCLYLFSHGFLFSRREAFTDSGTAQIFAGNLLCLQVCNAVAVASLLNATLVIPKFLYSNVWKDPSQFGDIYQEEYFTNTLKNEVDIVKELPPHLRSLDLVAIGSQITDAEIPKEASPHEYVEIILPLLLRNGIVHFLGFGNRLGFDPVSSELQFVPKIQEVGSLWIRRIRKHDATRSMLDKQLLGNFISNVPLKGHDTARNSSRVTKVGEMPIDTRRSSTCSCRSWYIYLAGSHIYGGQSRMHPLTSLYPNLVTKEDLLTPSKLVPFRNFSSQMAALDYIACATADVFAITDSGSQLSSLVSGFRTYYGGGRAPTLKPSKKRLAEIFSESSTIGWISFAHRIKKMIEEGQRVRVRGFGRSIYRQPRCPECMCRS